MRKAFMAASLLLLASLVLQMYFAAVGAFTKPAGDDAFALHSINGMAVIPALTLLTTLFAALSRAPGKLIGLSILPLGLIIVQVLIVVISNAFDDPAGNSSPIGLAIAGLHALNGMATMGVAAVVLRGARRLAQARPTAPAAAP
jgi:hypothetical protein